MALYFEKPEINTKFNLRTLKLTNILTYLQTYKRKTYMLPRIHDPSSCYGSHPVHNVISTFPTSSLLIALSLKFQSSKI